MQSAVDFFATAQSCCERSFESVSRVTEISFFRSLRIFSIFQLGKVQKLPASRSSSELSAHQMPPSGVIAHLRGRRALQLIRAECSSNGCPKSVRRSPVLLCRGERPIGLLVKWSEFLSHSYLHQAPFLCCNHAVERVTSKAAGYDCVIKATVREGQGMTAETTPPLCVAQKPCVGFPADYLASGTVDQWPPATGQRWNERRGGDQKTDQVTQGADS